MSDDKYYLEYAEDIRRLHYRRNNEPPCERCHNDGAYNCKDLFCADTRWAFQKRKPIDMDRAREKGDGWEYALAHLHQCKCDLSGWKIFDRQREHEKSKRERYI